MPKKGDLARDTVKDTIIKAFNDSGNYVGFQDKKIYVTAQDGPNGEVFQFAITMTMPKVPIAAADTVGETKIDGATQAPIPQTPVEPTPEDKAEVERLKKMLGITD